MKIRIKETFIKRLLPILVLSMATTNMVYASEPEESIITSENVMLGDAITIGRGYYDKDITINIPTKADVIKDLGSATFETEKKENGNLDIKALTSGYVYANSIAASIKKVESATGSYYTGGNNIGLGVGTGSKQVSLEGVNELSLGVSEAVTLPSGYYPNDITIKNNVKKIGQVTKSLGSGESYSLSEGYYTGGRISSDIADSLLHETVLWTNPEPAATTAFAKQAITHDRNFDKFDYLGVYYRLSTTDATLVSSFVPVSQVKMYDYAAKTTAGLCVVTPKHATTPL